MNKYFLFLLAFALVGAGCAGSSKTSVEETTDTSTSVEQSAPADEVVKTLEGESFSLLSVSDWDGLERAEEDIQVLGEGQRLNKNYIQDPNDPNIIYLTSELYNEEENTNLLSVYSYNTSDYHFERIYKFLGTKENASVASLNKDMLEHYRLTGYDDGKLIFFISLGDYSPGPCANLYLTPSNEYLATVSMDISNPYGGFSAYEYNEDLVVEQTAIQKKCEEEFDF